MKHRHLRTSDLSKAAGVHPNTVRLYETWGFLPPIPRSPGGYRQFTKAHLEQVRLARLALKDPWPGRRIRQSALALVRQAATGDLAGALATAESHLSLVRSERGQAQAAAEYLEQQTKEANAPQGRVPTLSTSQAATVLDITVDTLRHWERNGLLSVPRNPANGYRCYGSEEIGRLRIIRMLTRAGFSTMAVLRTLRQLDQGRRDELREVINTPGSDEDILYAADRWLSTLDEQEQRSLAIIECLQAMIRKRQV